MHRVMGVKKVCFIIRMIHAKAAELQVLQRQVVERVTINSCFGTY